MKMEMATLTSNNQLTVPIAVRKKLDLKKGDKVIFIEDNEGVRILNASSLSISKTQGDTND